MRRHCIVIAGFAALAACAVAPSHRRGELSRVALFAADGTPQFALYLSCAGQVAAETALCWVPSKYFAQWAQSRHVAMRDLPDGLPFDAATGVPAAQRIAAQAGIEYRVVIRFAPYATGSYSSEADGMGGYTAPKAGYIADVYVYSTATDALLAQAEFHKRSDAAFKADAVPYVKAGVAVIVAALDPESAN